MPVEELRALISLNSNAFKIFNIHFYPLKMNSFMQLTKVKNRCISNKQTKNNNTIQNKKNPQTFCLTSPKDWKEPPFLLN